jgi:deoxyribose-phosphate aldolase
MDLTTLAGDDTPGNVRRLCAKARHRCAATCSRRSAPATSDPVGAVCVYHAFVPTAVEALRGSGIPVAAVSTGFPAGLSPFAAAHRGDPASVAAGARRSTSSSRARTC